MLLQKLVDYSRRQEYRPSLYGEGPVHYIVNLDDEGRFQSMIDIADPSNRRTRRGQIRLVPQVQRSSGIRPLLLADKADYTLGYAAEEKRADRAQRSHQAYVDLVERCATETEERDVAAVLRFLRDDPLGQVKPDELFDPSGPFDPSGIITFAVDNRVVVDHPAVQAFWASANAVSGAGTQTMQCLVCGNHRPGAGAPPGQGQGNPRRADVRHQHRLGKRGCLPVLRPARLPDFPHLRGVRRGVHPGHQCAVGQRADQVHFRQRRLCLLDPR